MPKKKESKQRVAVIRQPLVALTGNYKLALVLGQMLYWSERGYDVDDYILEERERNPDTKIDLTDGWIYKSGKDLVKDLMVDWSLKTTRRYLSTLVDAGYLDKRNNPKYKWDKCLQYRPNLYKIQRDLLAKGLVLDGYPILQEVMDEIRLSILKETSDMVSDRTDMVSDRTDMVSDRSGADVAALPEIPSEIPSEVPSELPTREKTRVVGPPTAVDNPSSLSGEAEPTSTQDQLQKKDQRVLKREIMPSSAKVHDHPGLVWTQDEDLLHVVDVDVEPEDTVITCPDCEEDQPWPRSQGQRRKEPALICHECGAYFRVHTEHNGRGKTYQLPIVGQEGRWMAHIDDVPYRVNSFPCTQAQAERLTRLWLEDAGTVRSLLVWIDKENLIQRAWRNHRDRIAGAVITGFKSRKQNSEGRKAAEQIHEEITTADSDVSALFEETK